MGIFSQAISTRHSRARRVLWTSLVFSLVGGMTACSSNKTDAAADSLDESSIVAGSETNAADLENSGSVEQSASNNSKPDARFGTRRAPQIKDAPFKVDGVTMNAYLFTRSPKDSWESISQLIYGRSDRADMIANWNQRGTLAVGRVIYYNSAARPDDMSMMKVLAEDFGIGLNQVIVKPGDSLSQIAQKLYGSAQSWKEIAALNPQVSNPDLVHIGQSLAIQPVQIDTRAALEQLIAQSPGASSATATNESNAPELQPSNDNTAAAAAPVETPQVAGESPIFSKLAESKDKIIIAVGAGIILIGLIGIVIRRRNEAQRVAESSWTNAEKVTKLTPPKSAV